jgi:hypothetical protein
MAEPLLHVATGRGYPFGGKGTEMDASPPLILARVRTRPNTDYFVAARSRAQE